MSGYERLWVVMGGELHVRMVSGYKWYVWEVVMSYGEWLCMLPSYYYWLWVVMNGYKWWVVMSGYVTVQCIDPLPVIDTYMCPVIQMIDQLKCACVPCYVL